jgi:beta-glucuronidase
MTPLARLVLMLACLVAPGGAAAAPDTPIAPAPLIVNPDARRAVPLDGRWQVIVDPLGSGDASPVAAGVEGAGYYRDRKQISPMELIEYKFSDKVALDVPGDWNTQDPRLFFYQSPVWYRQTFPRPAGGGRHFLYFGAVNYAADVYVNGRYVASHEGGFTPFNVDITDRLKDGENLLVLKVDNSLDASTVPTRKTDWFNYGGITRSVRLISTPQAFVRDYVVRLTDRASRRIAVTVQTDGGRAGDSVRVAIPELRRGVTLRLDAAGRAAATFTAPVALWSPETPRLYEITVSYGADTIRDRIGFRTIERRGEDLLLNGRPVFLKGISMHEESIRHPGRSFGREDARAMLGLVKQLGGNFVRLAHYPHDEATTRVADELGLLVWSEIPVYWSIDWGNARALASARAQLTENIVRDRNRASIVIWSVANETPMSAPRLAFLRQLVGTVRALDDSRLVSAALFGDPFGFFRKYAGMLMARIALDEATPADTRAKVMRWFAERPDGAPDEQGLRRLASTTDHVIDDPLGDDLDVVSYNQYFGWYPSGFMARLLPVDEPTLRRAELALMPSLRIDPKQSKPFIISEFGADAKAGFVGDEETVFSETFQARYYRTQFRMLANSTRLRGMAPWVLKDFRSFLRTHPDYQEYWNRKGLVSETGERKQAFGVLQSLYRSDNPFAANALERKAHDPATR